MKGGVKMGDNEQMVLEVLKKTGEPMRPGKIAEMTNLPKDEVSKIIKALKKKRLIFSPKRCFYAASEEK